MDDFNEINEALGRNFSTPVDIDEADLDAELEMLEDEFEEEMAETADATPSYLQPSELPDTPTTELPSAPTEDSIPAVPNWYEIFNALLHEGQKKMSGEIPEVVATTWQ